MKCFLCGVGISTSTSVQWGNRGRICMQCMEGESLKDVACPHCGQVMGVESDQVAMTFNRPGDTDKSIPVLVMVCSNCHMLFMDNFQYNTLKNL